MKLITNKLCYGVVLVLAIVACTNDSTFTEETLSDTFQLSAIEEDILRLTNQHRESIGKNTLVFSKTAYNIALEHTNYMIVQGEISHDNFSSRSNQLSEKSNAFSVGENVAKHYKTAQAVLDAWLSSTTGHKENIEGNFTHIAICARKDADGLYYFTQLFYKKQ
jgi:uncharacterized protein YkwD